MNKKGVVLKDAKAPDSKHKILESLRRKRESFYK